MNDDTFAIEVSGAIPVESSEQLETLRDDLRAVFAKYEINADIRLIQSVSIFPDGYPCAEVR